MKVSLIRSTEEPTKAIYTSARTCYSSLSPEEILSEGADRAEMEALIRRVVSSGHYSVLEHVSFSFGVTGMSRACSHQLVRHRIASYSQQSQRYVKAGGDFVIPPSIEGRLRGKFEKAVGQVHKLYQAMLAEGIPKEDARYVLPNCTPTNLVITMNLRELIHASSVRLCNRAQWEIRELFSLMKEEVRKADPFLAGLLEPKCEKLGYCPEEDGCGNMPGRGEVLG